MVGIHQEVIFGITRLKTTFVNDLGDQKVITGTGFWSRNTNGKKVFVTNKHNVDPTLKLGKDTKFKLYSLAIELRNTIKSEGGRSICTDTGFFIIEKPQASLRVSDRADCAIIVEPKFIGLCDGYIPVMLPDIYELATSDFLLSKVQIMDTVSFIGFPGNNMSEWWDKEWNLPIARPASISSLPWKPFRNEFVKTDDVLIVSGLSFSGSSGSPVFLHQKGFKPGKGITMRSYVPPTIIGIMSGHWWDSSETPEMFKHSGLSYFTTTRSILELIN